VSQRGSDQDVQDALGLKVSQFVALMGDQPLSQEKLNENAQYASQYAERLVRRLMDETQ
jgi:5,10-methylenetetrahydrofolate reductase